MFYTILFLNFEDLSIFGFLLKKYIIQMDIRTRIRTEPAMIRTKCKPKFVNIRIRFKFRTLKFKIRIDQLNPNINVHP